MTDHGTEWPSERIRRRVLAEDLPVFGGWLTIPSADLLAALTGSGLDYVAIDCQHTVITEAEAARLIAANGASAAGRMVRVAANRHDLIGRALDGGADGTIVPTVNDAAGARAAVAATRYPPDGVRSYGPIARYLPADTAALAAHGLVLPMIETKAGLAAVDDIVAVPGVDGVYVGPADLGIGLGFGPLQFPASPELEPALRAIARAARAAGKIAGIHAASALAAQRYLEFGFRLLTVGTDRALVAAGVSQALSEVGQAASAPLPPAH